MVSDKSIERSENQSTVSKPKKKSYTQIMFENQNKVNRLYSDSKKVSLETNTQQAAMIPTGIESNISEDELWRRFEDDPGGWGVSGWGPRGDRDPVSEDDDTGHTWGISKNQKKGPRRSTFESQMIYPSRQTTYHTETSQQTISDVQEEPTECKPLASQKKHFFHSVQEKEERGVSTGKRVDSTQNWVSDLALCRIG